MVYGSRACDRSRPRMSWNRKHLPHSSHRFSMYMNTVARLAIRCVSSSSWLASMLLGRACESAPAGSVVYTDSTSGIPSIVRAKQQQRRAIGRCQGSEGACTVQSQSHRIMAFQLRNLCGNAARNGVRVLPRTRCARVG